MARKALEVITVLAWTYYMSVNFPALLGLILTVLLVWGIYKGLKHYATSRKA